MRGEKKSGLPHRQNRTMEEIKETKETKEKKARKPRAKKAQAEEAVTPVPAVEEGAEKPKKRTAARKKKAVEQPTEQSASAPIEGAQETTPAEKESEPKKKMPAKRTVKKKAEKELPAELLSEEKKTEEPAEEKPQEQAKEQPKEKQPTRAERIEAVKTLVRETLQTECKWSELLDRAVSLYKEKYPAEKSEKINDLNGRIGSIIGQMKKDGEVFVEGGVAKLVSKEEKEEKPLEKTQEPKEEKPKEKRAETATVYDLSSLFSARKPVKTEKKEEGAERAIEKALEEKTQEIEKTVPSKEKAEKKSPKKEEKPALKAEKTQEKKPVSRRVVKGRIPESVANKDPLKELFLKKLRSLGGDYFEYYSVYLLEKYSRKNGRRLEGLKVSGGERDGGIDGELELTDRLGFRETLYVQAKNWQPTDEKWMVGETLLQQFIGAVTYRQAKEGKQHARGVFITTSRFTPEAKRMLAELSDKFVGYDGDDLYETAKECSFGLKEENGVWKIDEVLLAGEKAFFAM